MKKLIYVALFNLLFINVFAQDDDDGLFELSLEELMQIDIYSVSKKAESLFDAPLSSSTLTREEILNSGVTSIPEALRLVPGLIVREQTNGVYDIHLRGFDNLVTWGTTLEATNNITLVMIDDRPVFNNNLGGTYWEAIPIDIVDVERIEVVRGPSSPLYGPNAVAGVINIITRQKYDDGLSVRGNFNAGTPSTLIGGINLGYKANEKWSFGLSGNFQKREKFDNKYFSFASDDYVTIDQLGLPDMDKNFPNPDVSLDRLGMNGLIEFKPSDQTTVGLQLGLQDSEAQKIYTNNSYTTFSTSTSESKYLNLAVNSNGFSGRISYNTGTDDLNSVAVNPIIKYDFSVLDILVEYTFDVNDQLSIRPGFGYGNSVYSDKEYISSSVVGVLNGESDLNNLAGSISINYKATDKLRFIGAVRADKFSSPDETYVSYQLASTYKINDKNLIRAVYAKSNSGSFIGPNYINVVTPSITYAGNQNLDLYTQTMIELGYRTKLKENLELNVEVFQQQGENVSGITRDVPINSSPAYFTYLNFPVEATQQGLTFAINYFVNKKFQIKPFGTWQKTKVKNLHTALVSEALQQTGNIPVGLGTTVDDDHDQTPVFFGGLYINYKANDKWNFNFNPYYSSQQRQTNTYNSLIGGSPFSEVGKIDNKFIANASISYMITDNLTVSLSGRNFLDNDSREYLGGDQTSALYMIGIRGNF